MSDLERDIFNAMQAVERAINHRDISYRSDDYYALTKARELLSLVYYNAREQEFMRNL